MDAPFPPEMLPEIERFLAGDAARLPGLDVYQDVFDTGLFFPLQRQAETAEMIRVVREIEPRVVFEIGADKGGGFYHWVKCIPTVEIAIACEIRGTPYAAAFERAFPGVSFFWCPWGSRERKTVDAVEAALGFHRDSYSRDCDSTRIDVLFIDGDKVTMYEDFVTYEPIVRRGGVVFVHDITDPAPGAAFRKMQAHPAVRHSRIIHDVSDVEAALARERAGIPPSGSHEGWLRHWKGASCGVGVLYL